MDEIRNAQLEDSSVENFLARWRRVKAEEPSQVGDIPFFKMYEAEDGFFTRIVDGRKQLVVKQKRIFFVTITLLWLAIQMEMIISHEYFPSFEAI